MYEKTGCALFDGLLLEQVLDVVQLQVRHPAGSAEGGRACEQVEGRVDVLLLGHKQPPP